MSQTAASSASSDFWKSKDVATKYSSAAHGITANPANALVEKSGVISAIQNGPVKVLDNACGTGIVADTIYARLEGNDAAQDNLTLVATDLGPAMVEAMQAKIDKNGWKNAAAQVVDMQDMAALKDGEFDYVLTSLGINLPPKSDVVLQELHRILKPGGVNAFTTWRTVGWVSIVRDAVSRIDGCPPFPTQEEGFKLLHPHAEWQDADFIRGILQRNGFTDIDIERQDVDHEMTAQECASLFAGPMLKGMMTIFGYSKEDADKYADKVGPALMEMFEEKGQTQVVVPMNALITRAVKA